MSKELEQISGLEIVDKKPSGTISDVKKARTQLKKDKVTVVIALEDFDFAVELKKVDKIELSRLGIKHLPSEVRKKMKVKVLDNDQVVELLKENVDGEDEVEKDYKAAKILLDFYKDIVNSCVIDSEAAEFINEEFDDRILSPICAIAINSKTFKFLKGKTVRLELSEEEEESE